MTLYAIAPRQAGFLQSVVAAIDTKSFGIGSPVQCFRGGFEQPVQGCSKAVFPGLSLPVGQAGAPLCALRRERNDVAPTRRVQSGGYVTVIVVWRRNSFVDRQSVTLRVDCTSDGGRASDTFSTLSASRVKRSRSRGAAVRLGTSPKRRGSPCRGPAALRRVSPNLR